MIVLACNTATAVVWEEIKEKLDIPVLGVILPGASAAIKSTTHQIGVIGHRWQFLLEFIKRGFNKSFQIEKSGLTLSQVCSFSGIQQLASSVTKKVVYET